MTKISDYFPIVQLLKQNFGELLSFSPVEENDPKLYIEGLYDGILFEIYYKKNECLILSVSDKGQELLKEFGKVLKSVVKQDHICTYKLVINNFAVKNTIRYVQEWNMICPETRLSDLKQGNKRINGATICNLQENKNRKPNPALITSYLK